MTTLLKSWRPPGRGYGTNKPLAKRLPTMAKSTTVAETICNEEAGFPKDA